jgi:hypothetical protein
MPWDDYEPTGECEDCNQDLANDPLGDHDDTHRHCWACWRAENWDDDDEELAADLGRIERVAAITESCPCCGRHHRVLFPAGALRVCSDCWQEWRARSVA